MVRKTQRQRGWCKSLFADVPLDTTPLLDPPSRRCKNPKPRQKLHIQPWCKNTFAQQNRMDPYMWLHSAHRWLLLVTSPLHLFPSVCYTTGLDRWRIKSTLYPSWRGAVATASLKSLEDRWNQQLKENIRLGYRLRGESKHKSHNRSLTQGDDNKMALCGLTDAPLCTDSTSWSSIMSPAWFLLLPREWAPVYTPHLPPNPHPVQPRPLLASARTSSLLRRLW